MFQFLIETMRRRMINFGRILHLTVNEFMPGAGYNFLLVDLSTRGQLVVQSTPNGSQMKFAHNKPIPRNQWIELEISQAIVNNEASRL